MTIMFKLVPVAAPYEAAVELAYLPDGRYAVALRNAESVVEKLASFDELEFAFSWLAGYMGTKRHVSWVSEAT